MNRPYTTICWWPPGTGKTTYLIKQVEAELPRVSATEAIGYYAFTRAAAAEAIERITNYFPQLNQDDLKHFRTIHSECYRQLGLTPKDVFTRKNLADFGKAYNYRFTTRREISSRGYWERTEIMLQSKDDYMLFFEEWHRLKGIDSIEQAHREFWRAYPFDCPDLPSMIRFHQRYVDYKLSNKIYDFTDMLTTVLHEKLKPNLEVIMVDEAQDLSPLEFEVIKFWAEETKRLYMVGDPLQCVYAFQSADPNLFFEIPSDNRLTLSQSYRVPIEVHKLAMRLARRTPVGEKLVYYPVNKEGFVQSVASVGGIPFNPTTKYFILARNRYLLEPIEEMLLDSGYPFSNIRGMKPLETNMAKAVSVALILSKDGRMPITDVNILVKDFIPSNPWLKKGAKTELAEQAQKHPNKIMSVYDLLHYSSMDLINRIKSGDFWDIIFAHKEEKEEERVRQYLHRMVSKHGKIIEPNIILGTFHSVKGRETDISVCLSDMGWKTFREYINHPHTEIPPWYVAVTRAKEGVFIVEPQDPEKGKYFKW